MSNPNAYQIGGEHYQAEMQVWDFVTANNIGYLEGNAIKYLARWRKKGGLTDLEKARHYVEKLIALEQVRKVREEQMRQASAMDSVSGAVDLGATSSDVKQFQNLKEGEVIILNGVTYVWLSGSLYQSRENIQWSRLDPTDPPEATKTCE